MPLSVIAPTVWPCSFVHSSSRYSQDASVAPTNAESRGHRSPPLRRVRRTQV
jgi:hypothetical protein